MCVRPVLPIGNGAAPFTRVQARRFHRQVVRGIKPEQRNATTAVIGNRQQIFEEVQRDVAGIDAMGGKARHSCQRAGVLPGTHPLRRPVAHRRSNRGCAGRIRAERCVGHAAVRIAHRPITVLCEMKPAQPGPARVDIRADPKMRGQEIAIATKTAPVSTFRSAVSNAWLIWSSVKRWVISFLTSSCPLAIRSSTMPCSR